MWIALACASAFFAGITSILAKCGIRETDSTVATAIRTIVVLVFAWIMVFVAGSFGQISSISTFTWVFLVLSGIATGASWLCYFKALQLGDVNKVAPIDKTSTVLTMLLAFLLLGESFSWTSGIAMVLILAGTFMMIERKKSADTAAPADNASGADAANATDVTAESEPNLNVVKASAVSAPANSAQPDDNPQANEAYPATTSSTRAPRTIKSSWLWFAVGSAVFASLVAILGKVGIEGVESNLGTAIRTVVVLAMSWIMVAVTGKGAEARRIPKRDLVFICLSGLATGASWLCYFRALQDGLASVVVPIDKLSIIVTIAFSYLVFKEKLTRRSGAGLALIVAGTLLMTLPAI